MYRKIAALFVTLCGVTSIPPAVAQTAYPPGTFSVDGFPIQCGPVTFILDPTLPDAGIFFPPATIALNPSAFNGLPTPLKLWMVGHECGHFNVGSSETQADCWSVKIGKSQGWFPPQTFNALTAFFANNPGGPLHPPGQARVANMIACYNSP
jgi:hypothetical protein